MLSACQEETQKKRWTGVTSFECNSVVVLKIGPPGEHQEDGFGQAILQDWLGQKTVHTRLQALVAVAVRGVGSHGNDR